VILPNTELHRLTSKRGQVDYKIYVALPSGYEHGKNRYGIVYLLDADYSFAIARNVVEHLSDRNHLPPLIVVGVAYDGPLRYRLNRTRDYTPTHTLEGGYGPEMQKHSGGGPAFSDFITNELVPFIDRTYRTVEGRRALVGHSYGGLFATWTLLTTGSAIFDRYIVVSPSLWYDERMIFSVAPSSPVRAKAYFAVGAVEARQMAIDLQRLVTALRKSNKTLAIRHEVLDDETHNSVFPSAFSRGVRWAFDGR